MDIKLDDLSGAEIQALLRAHLDHMMSITPMESVHALDVHALRKPDVTFWTAWESGELLGCGALKELDAHHGEIKSMRTVAKHLRKGVARQMVTHILAESRRRTYKRVSLETGSAEPFLPARLLYESFGFTHCAPFADYIDDPNSVFMTLTL
jgi:putative acetyltransferase